MANITQGKILQVLDWTYDKAINGVAGMDTASELANSYSNESQSKTECANTLIRWQNVKAGSSGFIAGVGGAITLPVVLPANITSVLYIQVRMIAAIASMGGYDTKSDQVKTLVYACLTGNSAKDVLKGTGISVGNKMASATIKKIPGKVLTEINKKVGFRLVTKFGEKGVINLGKLVPLVGGFIGCAFDSATTNTIGNVARDLFILSE